MNTQPDNEPQNKEQETATKKKITQNPIIRELLSWLEPIGFAAVFSVILLNFVIVNAVVPTGSMENTIMPKDRLIANRLAYLFSEPKRFDIVVFRYPDNPEVLFVKRIIGMPGDKIDIVDGKVYLNDEKEPIDDSFIKEPMVGSKGPYLVPENCYFMLGDNRNDSKDSRFWKNTYVEKDELLGKASFRYFPLNRFTYLGNK